MSIQTPSDADRAAPTWMACGVSDDGAERTPGDTHGWGRGGEARPTERTHISTGNMTSPSRARPETVPTYTGKPAIDIPTDLGPNVDPPPKRRRPPPADRPAR